MAPTSSLRALVLIVFVVALGGRVAAAQDVIPPPPLRALDFGPLEAALGELSSDRRAELDGLVIEATFEELQSAMDAGDLTSVELSTTTCRASQTSMSAACSR